MSTAAGHIKFYEMEKTETIKVREFDMEREPRPIDLLSPNRKIRVTDTRGNLTNCGILVFLYLFYHLRKCELKFR